MPRVGKQHSELTAFAKNDPRPPKRRLVYGVQKKGVGRKETTITAPGLEVVEAMSRNGHSEASIAKSLGISHRCFKDLKIRDARVQEALDFGHSGLADELSDILLDIARDRSHKMQCVAAIYLTKSRCGWVEGQAPETRPNVTIVLPDSQSPDDYMRSITVQHAPKGELPE